MPLWLHGGAGETEPGPDSSNAINWIWASVSLYTVIFALLRPLFYRQTTNSLREDFVGYVFGFLRVLMVCGPKGELES